MENTKYESNLDNGMDVLGWKRIYKGQWCSDDLWLYFYVGTLDN